MTYFEMEGARESSVFDMPLYLPARMRVGGHASLPTRERRSRDACMVNMDSLVFMPWIVNVCKHCRRDEAIASREFIGSKGKKQGACFSSHTCSVITLLLERKFFFFHFRLCRMKRFGTSHIFCHTTRFRKGRGERPLIIILLTHILHEYPSHLLLLMGRGLTDFLGGF